MEVIGLTGGIAAGKSLASQVLSDLGAHIINADLIGHEIYLPHKDAWKEIVATFGPEVLRPDQTVDRAKLGSIVFGNPEALTKLNQITHPRIIEEARVRIDEQKQKDGQQPIVFEAAILIEANWLFLVNKVWVVVADKEVAIERLRRDRNLAREQAESRIASQLSNEERAKYAHVLLQNNGTVDELRGKIMQAWQGLLCP